MVSKFKRSIVGSILVLLGTTSHALVVFDPSNFSQNMITSIKAVANEINQINILKEQLKSNMASLNIDDLNAIGNQYRQLQTLYNSAQELKSSIGQSQNAFKNIEAIYGASQDKTWNSFMEKMAKRRQLNDSATAAVLGASENADKQVEASYIAHKKIAAEIGRVSGVTEATQATAAAVGVVVQNGQAMLALMSSTAKQQTIDSAKRDQREADAETAYRKYKEASEIELRTLMEKLRSNRN